MDNLQAAMIKSNRYESLIIEANGGLAFYYTMAVRPAGHNSLPAKLWCRER